MAAESCIKIMCPRLTCRKILQVPESSRGKTVKCGSCSTMIRIPEAKTTSKPEAEERKSA